MKKHWLCRLLGHKPVICPWQTGNVGGFVLCCAREGIPLQAWPTADMLREQIQENQERDA